MKIIQIDFIDGSKDILSNVIGIDQRSEWAIDTKPSGTLFVYRPGGLVHEYPMRMITGVHELEPKGKEE